MFFSIAAPQVVQLPDGTNLQFRVNAADSSLVEIHIAMPEGPDGAPGAHIMTFKRNGTLSDATWVPKPVVPAPTKDGEPQPLADYKSVDDEAVRNSLASQNAKDTTVAPGKP